MNQSTETTLQNVLTEKDLCDLLGMTKGQVADLRNRKGLPFIKVSQRNRLYFEKDIIEFFKTQRMILNRAELD